MQQLRDIMTKDVQTLAPGATVQQAAEKMRDLDVGAIPVCDGQKLVGMVTDRDIAVRSASLGHDPKSTKVADVMSPEVVWCFDDAGVDEVARLMRERQVRRIPVVNRGKQLVGIVALGDVATESDDHAMKGQTLEAVSRTGR